MDVTIYKKIQAEETETITVGARFYVLPKGTVQVVNNMSPFTSEDRLAAFLYDRALVVISTINKSVHKSRGF